MAYSEKLLARYISLVTQPISESNQVGEDVRFSVEFEAMEREVAKTQSVYETSPVDWQKVRESGELILQNVSKDLRVACWLSWALYKTESFAGLLAGCGMIEHLCRGYWDSFAPRKARTRHAALGWFIVRLDQALDSEVSVKDQLPLFQKLAGYLQGIDEIFTEKLEDKARLLLPVRRRLAAMVEKAKEAGDKPATVLAQVRQAAANLFAPPVNIDNEKDASAALKSVQDSARPLCAWWLRNKASDIRALRLNRALTWIAIDRLPDCNAQRVTAVRGLPGEKLEGFRSRFEQAGYADLVVDLEAELARAPFWFDGQFLLWRCLKALKADVAIRESEVYLALFISQFPGVTELRFEDGRPFADPATKSWILEHVMSHVELPQAPKIVESEPSRRPWEIAQEEATSILASEGIKPVVQKFKQHIQEAVGERDKFHWRLTLARVFHQARKYELAKSQLEALDEQLRSGQLTAWESELNLEVLRLLYSCYRLLPQNTVVRECKEELYRRLCHLDIESVLE